MDMDIQLSVADGLVCKGLDVRRSLSGENRAAQKNDYRYRYGHNDFESFPKRISDFFFHVFLL
jgi:hypothetical protein